MKKTTVRARVVMRTGKAACYPTSGTIMTKDGRLIVGDGCAYKVVRGPDRAREPGNGKRGMQET
jgi:hypothetical protein